MQVQMPLLLVHYAQDDFCNALRYPRWFERFEIAMNLVAGDGFGQRQEGFTSVTVQGSHEDAHLTWLTFQFSTLTDEAPQTFWNEIWQAFNLP